MPLNEIQFFFCALGAFASLCFGLYLIIAHNRYDNKTRLIGWIVLLIGLRVSISCLYFFSFNFSWSLVQVGLMAHLFSALLLLIHFQNIWVNQKFRKPIILGFTTILLISFIFSFDKFPSVWNHTIRYLIHIVVGICILSSAVSLLRNKIALLALKSKNGLLLIFYTSYCLVFSISLFTNYSLGPLLYSLLTFLSLIYLVFQNNNKSIRPEKYLNKKLSDKSIENIKEGLQEYLVEKRNFVNPRLKISDVAKMLDISIHELSEYLNDVQKISYPNYIKKLRVEEAMILLVEDNNLSIEGVGFEAGFNSRSSFFSTFKKLTDVTPTAYKRSKISSSL